MGVNMEVITNKYKFINNTLSYYNKLLFNLIKNILPNNTILNQAKKIEKELDAIETIPILFSTENKRHDQKENYEAILEKTDITIKKLFTIDSPEAREQRRNLKYKFLSLKYRLEEINNGINPSPVSLPLINILKKIVRDWKSSNPFKQGDSGISDRDLSEIIIISMYPEFVHMLIDDKKTRDSFMLWTFRDGNSAQIFIEYPFLQKKIVESNLGGRIGRIGKSDLKIIKRPVKGHQTLLEKIVTLPFEGIDQNILDQNKCITFRGGLELTIGEVFLSFKNKNFKVGNLEYLAQGITNWNAHKWGYWSETEKKYIPIDLSHHQWWKQLPLFEIITQEEALIRYEKKLNGEEWCVSATATRGTPTLDYENTHAFFEIAIPCGDGRYSIYNFGKFAMKFPKNFFEAISIFCQNLHATVAYPDENVFYSHRQQTYHSFVVSAKDGMKLMDLLKIDMKKSNQMNFVYQIESDNCAKWVHHHLENILGKDNVPDMFRMHLLDTEPVGFVSLIFKLIKKLPKNMQTPVLTFFHLPLGAAKKTWIYERGEKICKSLTRHEFWETGIVYLPALLHRKKEKGLLKDLNNFLLIQYTRIKQTFSKSHLFSKSYLSVKDIFSESINSTLNLKTQEENLKVQLKYLRLLW